ncbi:hypothetical protein J4E96_03305 [Pengzhenrongella sicca]|uniref:Uncharacterized protein n=2 Tax=Pengzhenrongella sicca TaxID=2819238 RepID=A0A8A4ZK00_9MICO|nr:hypothetical protein J4E96_03305 [Pengzhenrongella sicca]
MWSVRRFPGERMWVTVTERTGDRLVGTLNSMAIYVYMHPDEAIKFHIDDIIDCALDNDELAIEAEAA